jgi:hypothetical protein
MQNSQNTRIRHYPGLVLTIYDISVAVMSISTVVGHNNLFRSVCMCIHLNTSTHMSITEYKKMYRYNMINVLI